MAKQFNPDQNLSPQALAKQLRQPEGEAGKKVGVQMNNGNKYICINSYKVLSPNPNTHILEIGMGNGFFVKDLLTMASNLTYTGVDFSETMVQEAELLNQELINKGKVSFTQASIEKLPFNDNEFDSITTTNTLYFWPNPELNIIELLRVLKPNGKLLIAYRTKQCLDQIELSKHGFEKYELGNVEKLLKQVGFKNVTTTGIPEPDLDFDGTTLKMEGIYTTGIK